MYLRMPKWYGWDIIVGFGVCLLLFICARVRLVISVCVCLSKSICLMYFVIAPVVWMEYNSLPLAFVCVCLVLFICARLCLGIYVYVCA